MRGRLVVGINALVIFESTTTAAIGKKEWMSEREEKNYQRLQNETFLVIEI